MPRGCFITFEGLDGSGQSTQVGLLADRLKRDGHKVLVTKEPTNNLIGGLIRAGLTKEWKPSNQVLQLLYAADRGHHLDREILPAVQRGFIVISDRYFWSSLAFGSIDLDLDWLKTLNQNYPLPDQAFYIQVSPKTAIKRIQGSRFEVELFEEEEKLNTVADTYQKLTSDYPVLQRIDGERAAQVIHEEIYRLCRSTIPIDITL